MVNFFVLANSKLTGFTAVSYFFTLTRDEPKKGAISAERSNVGLIMMTRCKVEPKKKSVKYILMQHIKNNFTSASECLGHPSE